MQAGRRRGLTNRIGEGSAPMGEIGTERREVEFEPLTDEPETEPVRQTEPAPEAPAPART